MSWTGGAYGSYGNLGLYGSFEAFGTTRLTEASPPQRFYEPLDIDEMQAYLNLPDSMLTDASQSDQLSVMITAAREQAEIFQNRDLVRKQYDLVFDYWPNYRIELRGPLVSVDLFRYRDSNGDFTVLTQDVDYIVDTAKHPGIVAPMYNRTWPTFAPWPASAMLIRYTCGYTPDSVFWSDAGARVKIGMKLLVSDWWNRRLPFAQVGAGVAEFPFAVTSCLSYGAVPRAR